MARLKINILGPISDLNWMGMDEFSSDDHYIYYCGQESHTRNAVALISNKRESEMWYLGASQKQQNDLFVSKVNHSTSQ